MDWLRKPGRRSFRQVRWKAEFLVEWCGFFTSTARFLYKFSPRYILVPHSRPKYPKLQRVKSWPSNPALGTKVAVKQSVMIFPRENRAQFCRRDLMTTHFLFRAFRILLFSISALTVLVWVLS